MAKKKIDQKSFYKILKSRKHVYSSGSIGELFAQVNKSRVEKLSALLTSYLIKNLPDAIEGKSELSDYRTNPYVLVTSASILSITDPQKLATFLFNNKLYAGLETSFGKSIEAILVGQYPIVKAFVNWSDAPEKVAESRSLEGLSDEEKARKRNNSVWREIDKSSVVGDTRYLVGIKSGPNNINDTQVDAMKSAIATHHETWMKQTQKTYRGVKELDIVLGITYGTDKTTNNKENQILVKLLEHGFVEENREKKPGVLIDSKTHTIRVYRVIGQDFWSFIGNPANPKSSFFVYLEILLSLSRALFQGIKAASLEDRINQKMDQLSKAFAMLKFPRGSLPIWVREDFSEDELFLMAASMSAFFDEGI